MIINVIEISILGRCVGCFKAKRSTKYCRQIKGHKGDKAAPCPSCFEQGISVSECRLDFRHCGPGASWCTTTITEAKENNVDLNLPACCYQLASVSLTSMQIALPVDQTTSMAYTGPQSPHDYGTGYFTNYSDETWELWMKSFSMQTGTEYKICTGKNINKEANTGVLEMNGKQEVYKVIWQKQYTCHRGGKARYKKGSDKENVKPRNAPGTRLTECKATINIRLLKLESGDQILYVSFPLLSAHTGHTPCSIADLHSFKPLPEIVSRVESLVTHSHLSQISLMLAVKEWVNQELIPRHLQQGVLTNRPSEFDRRYFPTVEDLRNITRHTVNKIRNNMLDQDALETLLKQEQKQSSGFQFYLRKYKGRERNADIVK